MCEKCNSLSSVAILVAAVAEAEDLIKEIEQSDTQVVDEFQRYRAESLAGMISVGAHFDISAHFVKKVNRIVGELNSLSY